MLFSTTFQAWKTVLLISVAFNDRQDTLLLLLQQNGYIHHYETSRYIDNDIGIMPLTLKV